MKQQIDKKQLWYVGLFSIILVVGIILFFIIGKPFGSTGGQNQNGTYVITSISGLICADSYPPQCSGEITLRSAESGDDQQGTIDSQTIVHRDPLLAQMYPDSLREGMTVEVAFKPGSNIISSINLVD